MSNNRVIALGFFDGVHVGHGALLRIARSRADVMGCPAVGLTLDPHPNDLIFGKKIPLINTLEERRLLMTRLYHMDEMVVLPFDRKLMELPWDVFVREILVKELGAVHLVCGHDYTFGHRGLGNAEKVQELCKTLGLGCDVVEKVELLGEEVSSTRIRRLLKQGETEIANILLGHRHFFVGTVVHGKRMGHRLGCPTANLILPQGILVPARGVYAAWVTLPDGKRYQAVTNVGNRPTLDDGDHVTVENWLLDYSGDLYGKRLQVELCKFLRPEKRFSSVEELRTAIRQDSETAREYLK